MKKSIYLAGIILSILVFGFAVHKPIETPSESPLNTPDTLKIAYNPVSEIQSILSPFDSIIAKDFDTEGLVGGAVVVTYKGQIVFTKCFGVKKEGEQDSVDAHTIFRLASVSKSVTGVLACIMDDEALLSLDDKVVDYLPQFQLKNPAYTQQLSIRNILSQTSGVVPHAYDLMVEDKVPLEKIMTYFNEASVTAAPGKMYTYQNVVYSIYEPIIKVKTHKNFEQLMNEKVFQPFGMNDASLNFQSFKEDDNKAYPHVCVAKRQYRSISLNDRYYNTAPAAGVNASITDMGHLLTGLSGHYPHLFSAEANTSVFSPQINTPVRRKYFKSWGQNVTNISYGIGWRLLNYRGHKVAYHGGYVKGYKAEIALCNNDDIGIAILSNSPNIATAKYIPTFLNMYFDSINTTVQD